MSLYKRGDVWYFDFVIDGQRFNKSTGTSDKAEARRIEKQARQAAVQGAGRLCLAEAVTRGWEERWKFRKDGEQTIDRLHTCVRILGFNKPLDAITPADIEALKVHLSRGGRKPATVNRYLAALRTLLRMAKEWGAVSDTPVVRLSPEKPEQRRALSAEESEALLRAASPEARRLFAFLLDTGLRLGEALKLTDADVKQGCAYLDDTKSGRPRVVPLTQRALSSVEGRKGRLFPMSKWTYEREFKRAVQKAGLNPQGLCIHALRHTCCTRLVSNGAGLAAAGAILGHSTATMTSRYSHLDIAALRKTVSLLEG